MHHKKSILRLFSTAKDAIKVIEEAVVVGQNTPETEPSQPPSREPMARKSKKLRADDFKNVTTHQYISARPFPMNPFFIPKQPLSDQTRQQIYKLYLSDPSKWTPRALAEQFGLSIVRTEAILRLKSLESSFVEKNVPVQTELVAGMEKMLNSLTISAHGRKNATVYEPIREHVVDGKHPFELLLEEEERFSPLDAAELLKREPFKNIQKRLDIKAARVFTDKPVPGEEKVLRVDEELKGKNDFMIVDVSRGKKEEYLVREKNGKLRKASVPEVWKERKNSPQKYTM